MLLQLEGDRHPLTDGAPIGHGQFQLTRIALLLSAGGHERVWPQNQVARTIGMI
jgi:hypothetical protein